MARAFGSLAAILLALAAATSSAQTPTAAGVFPTRPVRLIVGFAPGGGTDIIARLVAQKLAERWGQPVIVDNRPGASGNIGAELVARSAPDGYALLVAFSSHASNPALSKLPFDINRDFTSITQIGSAPMVIVAHPALPAKTLGELIDHARAHPGAIKFGSSGVGTPVHLAGELMMQLTGISMVHVPYKGIAPAMAAILGGEIQLTYAAVLSGLQHFRSGRLKPLAVASRTRYPALPDVPTTAEAGLAGYEVDFWYALLGPGGMPGPLVERIQRDLAALLNSPEMKESLAAQGCIAVGGRPEALTALIRTEYELWSGVVKARGVRLE
jgi:tripartite-type tricarboxylate transporter receptor subunit TctC